jgi:hypothetical protein
MNRRRSILRAFGAMALGAGSAASLGFLLTAGAGKQSEGSQAPPRESFERMTYSQLVGPGWTASRSNERPGRPRPSRSAPADPSFDLLATLPPLAAPLQSPPGAPRPRFGVSPAPRSAGGSTPTSRPPSPAHWCRLCVRAAQIHLAALSQRTYDPSNGITGGGNFGTKNE